ncbi:DUF58 domain-containing protein [Pararhizobium mangrovi]|uniref:DUF58 domain-containing protein n=1 Tax=Pararhizobium mangrovi TaxID=2590452 RepID=A0A506UHU3_9HYPH|nr:DUF58 domain-containing protein [Pararhizobium mangrovi]TPW32868.1 DUF58 domain-containing protein [Pararhizobium mangrovi]
MASLGRSVSRTANTEALARARQRAALVPDCLVEASRIAHTAVSGWHGRRRRGTGENFWQFRPYTVGESVARIDWRRSARDDHTYLRDREWEAAHTLWLWSDPSPSMLFKSDLARASKEARALVLQLALAEVLARSGERIASPAIMEPTAQRNAAERLAGALVQAQDTAAFPDFLDAGRYSEVVLVGDFLDEPEVTMERLAPIARRGIRGHVVEVCDPAEEVFPYAGRTEFRDPETGSRLTAGRAETVAEDYRRAYLARRETLAGRLQRLGWTFLTHRTDRPASEALIAVHMRLSGDPAGGRRSA